MRISLRDYQKGQSIIEYLILMTVIVIALVAIQRPITDAVNSLFNASAGKVTQSSGELTAM